MNGLDVPEVILEHWYVCGRKVKHATYDIAWLHTTISSHAWGDLRQQHQWITRHPYLCDRCGYWHMGRKPNPTVQMAPSRRKAQHHHNMARAWDQQAYRDFTAVAPSKAEMNESRKRATGVACTPDEPVPPQVTPKDVQTPEVSPGDLARLLDRFNHRS